MKKPGLRAVLILACVALVAASGTCHAGATFLNIFPSDIFKVDRAQAEPAGNNHNNFFSMALGMVPASDETSKQQVSGLLSMKNSYDSSSVGLPSRPFRASWMSPLVSSGVSTDNSKSAAGAAYSQFIKRFNNQSSIYSY